jgi:hypothetical protein
LATAQIIFSAIAAKLFPDASLAPAVADIMIWI